MSPEGGEVRATILIVDDEPDNQRHLLPELTRHAEVQLLHPSELDEGDLAADLVLVDYVLEQWPERDSLPFAVRPPNGLALAAVLRQATQGASRPTAFALHSAHVREMTSGLPRETREHAFARAHDLEWVFPKVQDLDDPPLATQFVQLAESMRELPDVWPSHSGGTAVRSIAKRLLGLGETDWLDRAWADVENCHPPLHELSLATHGVAFIRWFLHRVLPYPCFLLDMPQLATRLRIKLPALAKLLAVGGDLTERLADVQYEGVLDSFLGIRWWRAGVETLIWEITHGNPFDSEVVYNALQGGTSVELERLESSHPVLCLDREYRLLQDPIEVSEAVRVQPDDWPPYADQAWTSIELARDEPVLRALVIELDQQRIA